MYANRRLLEEARADVGKNGMGTTLVASVCSGDQLHVANIGDSRLYVIGTHGIRQVTRDHSLVEEMVRLGEMDKADAGFHPDKNIITRAIGMMSDISVDFFETGLEPGDVILMCSDGLTNMVDDANIARIVSGEGELKEKAERLVDSANKNGGSDNITVVLIEPFSGKAEA